MSWISDVTVENTTISAAPVRNSRMSLSHSTRDTANAEDQQAVDRLHEQRRQPHPLELAEPRDDQRADDRAGAGERQQVAVGAGAFVEHLLREERQERQHREPEERRRRGEDDQRDEAAVVAHVATARSAARRACGSVPAGGMCFTRSDISA